jgi:hypothetical protein
MRIQLADAENQLRLGHDGQSPWKPANISRIVTQGAKPGPQRQG